MAAASVEPVRGFGGSPVETFIGDFLRYTRVSEASTHDKRVRMNKLGDTVGFPGLSLVSDFNLLRFKQVLR
jgi:hypothetical protein